MKDINSISGEIIFAAIQIHQALGPGLTENVYEAILARDLKRRGYHVERQKRLSFEYDGMRFSNVGRVDLVVNGCVLIEVKSVRKLTEVHMKQLLTYLKITGAKLGLILNFGAARLKDGLKRIVNGLEEPEK